MSSASFRNDLGSDDEPNSVPRVRKNLAGQRDEWIVFFQPKEKPLNSMRISTELWKHYLGVTNVPKVYQNKLRVVVNNPTEANLIVCDPRFCKEYRVWIPARSVEIDGVVSEDGLTKQQILKGVGQFKRRNLPAVQIIDVRQMAKSEGEGTNKRFIPSSSFRLTGTALPDFLLIDNVLLLPVLLQQNGLRKVWRKTRRRSVSKGGSKVFALWRRPARNSSLSKIQGTIGEVEAGPEKAVKAIIRRDR